jgi:hypothetical protein
VHLYVEQWKARPAWLAMPASERSAWVAAIQPMLRDAGDGNVELIGFAVTDADAPHGTDYPYMAVWRVASLQAVQTFEGHRQATGWHDYFEQVNARGELQPAVQVLDHMARAETP